MPGHLLPSLLVLLSLAVGGGVAQEKPPAPSAPPPAGNQVEQVEMPPTVAALAESARKSVVVITVTGRGGRQLGLGTGFVVSPDGLIATNLHVIGEARPIVVQLADGKKYDATAVHASDRFLDLALIRIDARGLTPLPLGDSRTLKPGQPVVALGNPHGLKHSVVAGTVSGNRQIDGREMIQLAIPVEPGNSGGPVLDMRGRVRGVMTMKSVVTENLGFAMAANQLKPLLEKPNPIPMKRWLTIGTLNARRWTPLMGAAWTQRAGRIHASGAGQGFGGRSLCLSSVEVPKPPFEIGVAVRLDDESGAAGLVFSSDGQDRHYGFYPSGGRLRLSRFEGPSVFSWKVLAEKPSDHYRPGEWNWLKVRVEPGKLLCYVNDELVIESADNALPAGKVGLAKFRDTVAEFKDFHLAEKLPPTRPSAELVARINRLVDGHEPGATGAELVDKLAAEDAAGGTVLQQRAKQLEKQAAELRRLAAVVHARRVRGQLAKVTSQPDESKIDLLRAALLVARLDNDEVDVEAYVATVDRMAAEIKDSLPKDVDEAKRLARLNQYLFAESGFHGSRTNYYNPANSYLNEVIDDREGLPITLSVLYMEMARRLGLNVVGVALPGHFVVKHVPSRGEPRLIDPFDGGKLMSRQDAAVKVLTIAGLPFEEKHLETAGKRAIVVRMLHNLLGVAREREDTGGMLRYLDTIIDVQPDSAQQRAMRAVLRTQQGDRTGAREDVDWLLDKQPPGLPLEPVRRLRAVLEREP